MANKNIKSKDKVVKEYMDLLYLTPATVHTKEIAALLQNCKEISIQLWEEMNILELELPSQNSVDFESLDPSFQDPSDAAFVKSHGINTIYAITICKEDLKTTIPIFEMIVENFAGFVCADREDFAPVYAGSVK